MNRANFINGLNSNVNMADNERLVIMVRSIQEQGMILKCIISIEEFAELQQAISKMIRYGEEEDRISLLEEMADAYICLELLKRMFEIDYETLQKAMDVKFQREKERLG